MQYAPSNRRKPTQRTQFHMSEHRNPMFCHNPFGLPVPIHLVCLFAKLNCRLWNGFVQHGEIRCKDISGTGAKINLWVLTKRNPQLKIKDTALLIFQHKMCFFFYIKSEIYLETPPPTREVTHLEIGGALVFHGRRRIQGMTDKLIA